MKTQEKIFLEDDIALNKKRDEDLKQLRLLIKRKEAELQKWKAHVAANISEIEREAEAQRRKEELKKLREDEARIAATRKELIRSARETVLGKKEAEEKVTEKKKSKNGKARTKKAKK